ncbi:MAG TPA: hypothetical protein VN108_00635 [Marmoricola sp.]|nr:hypothetical protein [Marmoricola sp.]
MAEDLPTLVDNFIVDIPKFEWATKVLSEDWATKIERAALLIKSGSYLESARTTAAIARETETAYPVLLDSLFKAAACAGYMAEALRLAYVGKDVTEHGVKATTLADDIRELTAAAHSPEQLKAYLTRISGNQDYRPTRPLEVMIAEVAFQNEAQTSGVTGDALAVQATADGHLKAGNPTKAIQGYLWALACGYPTKETHAAGMARLGEAYDLGGDSNRAIDWYRKALESGYLEGAAYADAAVRIATGMLGRGQNYTAIHWFSKAAEVGDDSARFKAGALLKKMERPVMARDMLKPLGDAGHTEALALLADLAS